MNKEILHFSSIIIEKKEEEKNVLVFSPLKLQFILIAEIDYFIFFIPTVFRDTNTPSPFNDPNVPADSPEDLEVMLPEHVHIDSVVAGLGCGCLQVRKILYFSVFYCKRLFYPLLVVLSVSI